MPDDSTVTFRAAAHDAADLVADYLADIATEPVWRPMDPEVRAALLTEPLPPAGRGLDELLATMRESVLPYPMGNGHPRFFGWVNSPPAPAGVLAALVAAASDPSCALGDHQAAAHLERTTLRWLAELVGYPYLPGGGLLTSGASMATTVALGAARNRAAAAAGHDVRAHGLFGLPPMVLYVSAEGHSCLRKAAWTLGLGDDQVRTVPSDSTGRMDVDALAAAIRADRAAGSLPFCVAASAGTVNAGLIDPLAAVAKVCADEDIWFHVDGAYGAIGVLDPSLTSRYDGMEKADSLALDPHKWLTVPVDCGCLLVRDPAALRTTYSLVPPYLRDDAVDADAPGWFAEYGVEQTRPFRALKVWATLAHAGRDGVRAHVVRCVELARELARQVEAAPDLRLWSPVETSIAAFRYAPVGLDDAELDRLNRAIPSYVQRRGQAFLTGTVMDGREVLRACVLHPDTDVDDLAVLIDEVRAAGRALR